ncbi:MAG: hypothetical protein N2112_04835 [Gemmataceae bacterium]|nr:hypothetical protein [Gemmataceae bacterium]
MRYYTCDNCGKDLSKTDSLRYTVTIHIQPNLTAPPMESEDLAEDSIGAFADMLADDETPLEIELPKAHTLELDLCPHCQSRFLADPLGRENRKIRFSSN